MVYEDIYISFHVRKYEIYTHVTSQGLFGLYGLGLKFIIYNPNKKAQKQNPIRSALFFFFNGIKFNFTKLGLKEENRNGESRSKKAQGRKYSSYEETISSHHCLQRKISHFFFSKIGFFLFDLTFFFVGFE